MMEDRRVEAATTCEVCSLSSMLNTISLSSIRAQNIALWHAQYCEWRESLSPQKQSFSDTPLYTSLCSPKVHDKEQN